MQQPADPDGHVGQMESSLRPASSRQMIGEGVGIGSLAKQLPAALDRHSQCELTSLVQQRYGLVVVGQFGQLDGSNAPGLPLTALHAVGTFAASFTLPSASVGSSDADAESPSTAPPSFAVPALASRSTMPLEPPCPPPSLVSRVDASLATVAASSPVSFALKAEPPHPTSITHAIFAARIHMVVAPSLPTRARLKPFQRRTFSRRRQEVARFRPTEHLNMIGALTPTWRPLLPCETSRCVRMLRNVFACQGVADSVEEKADHRCGNTGGPGSGRRFHRLNALPITETEGAVTMTKEIMRSRACGVTRRSSDEVRKIPAFWPVFALSLSSPACEANTRRAEDEPLCQLEERAKPEKTSVSVTTSVHVCAIARAGSRFACWCHRTKGGESATERAIDRHSRGANRVAQRDDGSRARGVDARAGSDRGSEPGSTGRRFQRATTAGARATDSRPGARGGSTRERGDLAPSTSPDRVVPALRLVSTALETRNVSKVRAATRGAR